MKNIEKLLNGTYEHGNAKFSVPIKSIYIDADIIKNAADMFNACKLKGSALIVSDENTYKIAGEKIEQILGENAASCVLNHDVVPAIEVVENIQEEAKKSGAQFIIAVGGGTINDICKYASFVLKLPYVVFATAPSMNGYSSANASIIIKGHKKTLKAHMPRGIFMDLEILAKAPVRLIRSGIGDLACRSTAQADWLLSNLVLASSYSELPFNLFKYSDEKGKVKDLERELFDNVGAIINGDLQAMRLLAECLLLSGFGMYLARGSYPASQGEHMIAHTMEMLYGDSLPHSYHGEQIAVTTLTMAKIQKKYVDIFMQGEYVFEISDFMMPDAIISEEAIEECKYSYTIKYGLCRKLSARDKYLKDQKNIANKIADIMIPEEKIRKILEEAGCPLSPEDIGWNLPDYQKAVKFAKYTRERFTFLDLE